MKGIDRQLKQENFNFKPLPSAEHVPEEKKTVAASAREKMLEGRGQEMSEAEREAWEHDLAERDDDPYGHKRQ